MSRCAAALKLPPSKVPTDFIGDRFVNTAIGFMVAQTVLVTLRYYARYLRKTPLGADDFLLPIAALFSYGQQTIGILMVKKGGVGHRVEYNCVHQPLVLPVFAKLQISNTLTLTVGIAFAKLTILQLFLRIFVTKVYRYATYTVMAIQIACMIMVIVMTFVQCTPFAYIWEPQKHPHGHCIDKNAFWRWGNFPQVLTDVAILVLPLPALCALKLSTRDKVGVIVTFCTGGIGLITSIVRFAMFFAIDGQADAGWQAVPLGSISIAETSVYVFAACLPSYRTFFSNSMHRFGTSADGSASRGKPALYGSSKSHELRSLDKSSRSGFSRLTHDDEKKRDWTSEEELVANGGRGGDIGLRSIQVHKSFVLKNEPL